MSVAMYDAWAAYDRVAVGYLYHSKQSADDVAGARREAISYAAYQLLKERYALSRNAEKTRAALDARMVALGYSTNNATLDLSTAAGLGNTVAALVSSYFADDGALQSRAYQELPPSSGGYASVNPPLLTMASGTLALNPNRWQPLAFTNAVSQNDIPVDLIQKFLGAQWLNVRPFALQRTDSTRPWFDPGPPPWLGTDTDPEYRSNVVAVLERSRDLTADDGVTWDISPGAFGNNPLGSNDGTGRPFNPVTGQPYASNLVKRGDFARVLAEFWADGPNSETPPGHWNVLANEVADSPSFIRRIGGQGPIVDALEWDVKVYFALNAAVHDAACAAWSLKRYYDGWRPIEAVRYMGQLGQATLPSDPTYHPRGLPLIPGLIEIVTVATSKAGARHAGLPVGAIAIYTWAGQPKDPTAQAGGVHWINSINWLPFQKTTFVTPAFPGYVSGHSAFSRAAAEVLAAITGSDFFPGGLSSYTISKLAFEKGPSQPVTLQWATYFDASDQAGRSRIWGGIHVPVDDFTGRIIGAKVGLADWHLAAQYFNGSILDTPVQISLARLNPSKCQLRCQTLRGFSYRVQATSDLSLPFRDIGPVGSPDSPTTDSIILQEEPTDGPHRFYQVLRTP